MVWVLTASVVFGIGGAFMKTSDGFGRLAPGVAALGCFLAGAVLLTMAIRAEGLSSAYTLGLGMEAVITIGLGRFVFDETWQRPQLLGVGLILLGTGVVRAG